MQREALKRAGHCFFSSSSKGQRYRPNGLVLPNTHSCQLQNSRRSNVHCGILWRLAIVARARGCEPRSDDAGIAIATGRTRLIHVQVDVFVIIVDNLCIYQKYLYISIACLYEREREKKGKKTTSLLLAV